MGGGGEEGGMRGGSEEGGMDGGGEEAAAEPQEPDDGGDAPPLPDGLLRLYRGGPLLAQTQAQALRHLAIIPYHPPGWAVGGGGGGGGGDDPCGAGGGGGGGGGLGGDEPTAAAALAGLGAAPAAPHDLLAGGAMMAS